MECGEQIVSEAKFCAKCGTKVEFNVSVSLNKDDTGTTAQSIPVLTIPIPQPEITPHKKSFPIKLMISTVAVMGIIFYIYILAPFNNSRLCISGVW